MSDVKSYDITTEENIRTTSDELGFTKSDVDNNVLKVFAGGVGGAAAAPL